MITSTCLVAALLANSETHVCLPHLSPGRGVVAISGTRTWRDVADDVDVRLRRWPPADAAEHAGLDEDDAADDDALPSSSSSSAAVPAGRVHRGFASRTLRLWRRDPQLRAFCLSHRESLCLTGWSLGGAVCICLSALLKEQYGIRVGDVRVFGCPRVGDADFAAWYEENGLWRRTLRVEMPCDPVARLPRGPFVHVGRGQVLEMTGGQEAAQPGPNRTLWQHHDLNVYSAWLRNLGEEEEG